MKQRGKILIGVFILIILIVGGILFFNSRMSGKQVAIGQVNLDTLFLKVSLKEDGFAQSMIKVKEFDSTKFSIKIFSTFIPLSFFFDFDLVELFFFFTLFLFTIFFNKFLFFINFIKYTTKDNFRKFL